jgi:hypothetical protein
MEGLVPLPFGNHSSQSLQRWGYLFDLSLIFGPRSKYCAMSGFGFLPILGSFPPTQG